MTIKIFNQFKYSLIFLLILTSFNCYKPVAAQPKNQISRNASKKKKPIRFKKKQQTGDRRGRPIRRRGMSSRNDCPATEIPLTALIPEKQVGKVVEANPTFWLFIPYESSKIPKGEFVLQDENHNDVYRRDFPINKGEGIVGVSLASKTSLETNKIYQWYATTISELYRSPVSTLNHSTIPDSFTSFIAIIISIVDFDFTVKSSIRSGCLDTSL